MKITDPKLKDFIDTGCMQIPPYQRNYEWTLEQAHELAKDFYACYKDPSAEAHWTGVLMMNPESKVQCEWKKANPHAFGHSCHEIIDGQQRLTTIHLLMSAIFDHHYKESGVESDLAENKLSIHLQRANADRLKEVLDKRSPFKGNLASISNLKMVYTYFRWLMVLGEKSFQLEEVVATPKVKVNTPGEILELWDEQRNQELQKAVRLGIDPKDGWEVSSTIDCDAFITSIINRTEFVLLSIEPKDQDPLAIFQVLNGNRVELNQFDLFRNQVFTTISKENSTEAIKLFNEYWSSAEKIIDATKGGAGKSQGKVATFLYDYLLQTGFHGQTLSANKLLRGSKGNKYFRDCHSIKEWIENEFVRAAERWSFACDPENSNAKIYQDSDFEISTAVRQRIKRCRSLSKAPSVPYICLILDRHTNEDPDLHIDEAEAIDCLTALESLLAGMLLTGIATLVRSKSMRLSQCNNFKNTPGSRCSTQIIESLQSWRPEWNQVRAALMEDYKDGSADNAVGIGRDPKDLLAIFDCIENALNPNWSGSFVSKDYEIEHIFPQSAPQQWKHDVDRWGGKWREIRKMRHNIGNLIPLKKNDNRAIKDKKLSDKQQKYLRYGEAIFSSPQSSAKWTEIEIKHRVNQMTEALKSYWDY